MLNENPLTDRGKKATIHATLLVAVTCATPAVRATLADDVTGELYSMKAVYNAEYAPAAWKRQFANYDLNVEFNKALAALQANPQLTIKQSREILKNFIYAMKDYHTSISFTATEKATLPLIVSGTADHIYIVYIDRTKLSEATFPFKVGDELGAIDGVPANQAVAAIQAQIPANVPETDRAMALARVTSRSASRGIEVPSGPVTLTIHNQDSKTTSDIQLIWEYTPEQITHRGDLLDESFPLRSQKPSGLFHPMMNVERDSSPTAVGSLLTSPTVATETPYDLGAKKSYLPDVGPKIWHSASDNTFDAYIVKRADRKMIGVVRIPSYEATDYVKAVTDFGKIVEMFENSTDAMVIDQLNNPGGSLFYLYALASMLTDKPLKTPLHRMAITQADVSDALTTIQAMKAIKNEEDAKKALPQADLNGYSPSYEFAQFQLSYAHFIVSEWSAGRKLSNPYWIGGVDHINPNSTHYSKPILILTNHLDFSGGDFFPTIMQDNKRVTVMGSRTAGAGGYVNDINVPNNVGVASFRCTESIAQRASGNPIENLGVTPDIAYELTDDDYQKNYAPFVKAINAAVDQIAP